MTNAASDSGAADCDGSVWRFEDQPLPDVIPEGVAVLHAVRSPTAVLPRLPASLRELSVTRGKLSDLGETDWGAMVNLETMDLSHNCLGEFRMDSPPPFLAELNLSYNILSDFSIGEAAIGSLATLNLACNQLSELPRCLRPAEGRANLPRVLLSHNSLWYTEYSALSQQRVSPAVMPELVDAAIFGVLSPARLREARYILMRKVPREVSAAEAAPYIYMLEPAPEAAGGAALREIYDTPLVVAKSERTTYESAQNVHVASNQDSLAKSLTALMRMQAACGNNGGTGALLDAFIAYHNPQIVAGAGLFPRVRAWFRSFRMRVGSGSGAPAWLREFQLDCASRHRHTNTGLSYRDIAGLVLNAAETCEGASKAAVYDILAEEIRHGAGLCFTGRVTRLVNALGGFVPGVGVTLSQKEAIQNDVIVARRRMAEKYGEDTDEYLANVTERVQRILAEHDGISEAECEAWVSAL